MSIYSIHVPTPDDHDYHADRLQHRRRRAMQSLDVGDILSRIDDALASEPDPMKHPFVSLVEFYLDRRTAVHGGEFFDACKQLVLTAIDRCVADALAQED